MSADYNDKSIDAVLSRIETKLDDSLKVQQQHTESIGKLWAALGRLDVRVAVIAATASGALVVIKAIFFNH